MLVILSAAMLVILSAAKNLDVYAETSPFASLRVTESTFRKRNNVGQVANLPETRQIGNLPHVTVLHFHCDWPQPSSLRLPLPSLRGLPGRPRT
jgi:hypothetical protein